MAIADFQTRMLPVLRAVANGADNMSGVLPTLIAEFSLTPEEVEEMIPSGRITTLQSRAHWARTYLSKAGPLESPGRNRHISAAAGRDLLANGLARMDMKTLEQFAKYRNWPAPEASGDKGEPEQAQNKAQLNVSISAQTPDERIEQDFNLIQHGLGVRRRRTDTLRSVDEDYFA